MNILAIDALGLTLSAAAQGPKGRVTYSFNGNTRSHAEQLIPIVSYVTAAAGFSPAETDMVLAPEGPGSFTGLRLGYAAAKALQLSTKAAFMPVPVCICLASQYPMWEGGIAALIDAKRDRFYVQFFQDHKAVTGVFDKTAEELLPYFDSSYTWLIAGYGVDAFKNHPTVRGISTPFSYIESSPAAFAAAMIDYAQRTADSEQTVSEYAGPLYVRKSDAEKD